MTTPILIHGEFPECLPSDEKFELIICDPPYGSILKEGWDLQDAEGYLKLAKELALRLTVDGSLFLWGGIGKPKQRYFYEFLSKVETETNLVIKNHITWRKRRAYGTQKNYLFVREELLWLCDAKAKPVFNVPYLDEKRGYPGFNSEYPAKSEYKRRTNVWEDITELFRGKIHPAEKPVKLSEVIIETHSNPGDRVLDPMCGSGAVGEACRNLGRRCVLIEKNDEYYKKVVERLGK